MYGVLDANGNESNRVKVKDAMSRCCDLLQESLISHILLTMCMVKYSMKIIPWKAIHHSESVLKLGSLLRGETWKISSNQGQGPRNRSSNVLCQPEFGSCSILFYSISLLIRSYCESSIKLYGSKLEECSFSCAGRFGDGRDETQLNNISEH